MVPYSEKPKREFSFNDIRIDSFISKDSKTGNIDQKTVNSFGNEWEKFNSFSEEEIEKVGNDYFDIIHSKDILSKKIKVLDVGCGSGRWSKYLSKYVGFIEAIDPSLSVFTASKMLKNVGNVRITHASTDNIPFIDNSFDLVISLGVLHHIPDTHKALENCVSKVKKGGYLLIYLYYNLENRHPFFKLILSVVTVLRKIISSFPKKIKELICDLIAIVIYWPLARFSALLKNFGCSCWNSIPLSYYNDKTMTILRNDALDRFGTPLEKRFSKEKIEQMLKELKMEEIVFSENEPYWHVLSKKVC